MNISSSEAGSVNPLVISNILVGIIAIALAGVSIWAYTNYSDQKNNVDSKIETAVTIAKKEQSDENEKAFLEREKVPTREFVGPEDLGRVSFQYPKTWSVYIAKNGANSTFEAYLNPITVPPVANDQPYATRVIVEDKTYETVVETYKNRVKKGELKTSPVTIGDFSGIRFDGTFTKERKGSAVVFKVRDKALTIASDAETFRTDFDNIVLTSLSFNP